MVKIQMEVRGVNETSAPRGMKHLEMKLAEIRAEIVAEYAAEEKTASDERKAKIIVETAALDKLLIADCLWQAVGDLGDSSGTGGTKRFIGRSESYLVEA